MATKNETSAAEEKAAKAAAAEAAAVKAAQGDDGDTAAIDGVECEILAPIRYGRERVQTGITSDDKPIMANVGKAKRLEPGETETLTLDEAERYELMGVVKVLVSAKARERLRERLEEQRKASRGRRGE